MTRYRTTGTEMAITILGTLAVGAGLIFLLAWYGLNFVGFGGAALMIAGVGYASRLAKRIIGRET